VPSEVVRVAFGAHVVPLLEPVDDLASGLPRHAEHRSEAADRHLAATKEP
jgi:hypothetical protein